MSEEKKMKLLLVEDERLHYMIIKSFLTDERYDLQCADSLELASSLISENEFDLIILDLGLPDSDGLETFKKVSDITKEASIVVFSGEEDESLAKEAIDLGAVDFLKKDQLSKDKLLNLIQKISQG